MRRPQADRANRRQLVQILALHGLRGIQTHTLLTIRIRFTAISYKWLQIFIVLQGFLRICRRLGSGHTVPLKLAAAGARHFMTRPKLSERELECLEWVSLGKTSWETGLILGVSERTINFHLLNAARKLNVYGRQAAVAIALRQNLLHGSPPEAAASANVQSNRLTPIAEPTTA
jgi:DNA-binding CsgD family transcriptional regulator